MRFKLVSEEVGHGTVGLLDDCELRESSCDPSIMLSVCRPVIILLQASKLVLQSKNHCINLFMRLN